jgi:DNA polymerase III delta prime subunit
MVKLLKQARHNVELLAESEERLFEIRDCVMRVYSEHKIGNGIKDSSINKLREAARMNDMVFNRIDELSKTIEGKETLNKFIFKD